MIRSCRSDAHDISRAMSCRQKKTSIQGESRNSQDSCWCTRFGRGYESTSHCNLSHNRVYFCSRADCVGSYAYAYLCLARAGSWTSWAYASCTTIRGACVDLSVGKRSDIWNFGIDQGSCSLATCWALSILLVGREIERDEK